MNSSAHSKLNWLFLCGHPQLNVVEGGDISACFRQLSLEIPVYSLFAAFNAYHLGDRGLAFVRTASHRSLLTVRTILTALLTLYPLGLLLGKWLINRQQLLHNIEFISTGVQFISWSLHFYYLIVLRTRISRSCRGPTTMILGWILTLVHTAFLLKNGLTIHWSSQVDREQQMEIYLSFVQSILQAVYLMTLIPKGEAREVKWVRPRPLGSLLESVERDRPIVADSLTNSCSSFTQPSVVTLANSERSGFFSKLVLAWVNPLLIRGCRQALTSVEDLFELPGRLKTTYIDTKFWIVFRDLQMRRSVAALQRPDNGSPAQVSVLRALIAAFGLEYFSLAGLKLLNDAADFAGPLLLNLLVNYVDGRSEAESTAYGYYLVIGLMSASLASSFLNVHYSFLLNAVGLKIRASLITTVYRKTLHLKSSAMSKFSTGQVVNFMSTDTDRVVNIFNSFHEFWSMPVKIAVCLFLLHQQVGVAYLAGVGFAILLIPINHIIAKAIVSFNKSLMDRKDKRVKLMTEIVFGIRAIKFYCWEEQLMRKISELRQAEVRSLKSIKYLDAFCVFFWAMTPILIAVLTFATYTLLGNTLTVSKVFTCLALFNLLMVPLNAFPWVLGGVVQGWVSVNRLQDIFVVEEVKLNKCYVSLDESSAIALFIRDGHFTWSQTSSSPVFTLKDIDLELKHAELLGVVGSVGSGKSSLLMAILCEMSRVEGEVGSTCAADGFAYVAQDPWIQNASIKDNIMFGRPLHPELYRRVVHACALEDDFKCLAHGDNTLVGERGITLSGGQKTRIALARAIYQDKDIYLIDDILSTLDSHVSQHVMSNAVHGLLGRKTRILCTHHWKYLSNANHVIVMNEGRIAQQGKPSEVLKNFSSVEVKTSEVMTEVEQSMQVINQDVPSVSLTGVEEEEDESLEQGTLKWKVYRLYSSSIGPFVTFVILLSLFLMQGCRNVSDWWLAHWMALEHEGNASNYARWPNTIQEMKEDDGDSYKYYLVVYAIIAATSAAATLIRAFVFAFGGIRAAVQLHLSILNTILRATVRFFDVTTVGRIMNRISSDTYTIDNDLPFVLNILLAQSFSLLGTFVIICYSIPWLVPFLLPLIAVYMYVQHYYRHTSRELRRLEAVTLSPIYSHFSESVLGLVTVRAFRYESKFKKENEGRLEKNQRAKYALLATSKWLSLRLQLIGVSIVTAIALFSVIQHSLHGINPGLVGLALSYGLSITVTLSTVVQFCTETEKEMVSVERTLQYIEQVEPERWEGFVKPHPSWPDEGVVSFHNVTLRYRQNQQPALNNLSFSTLAAEKIGVAGRTGAGKSSLFNAIFRLVELEKGGITVDGLVLAYLDLKDLRRKVAVIPQDPFLFSGTIRNNLDPSDQYEDDEVWEAVDLCHMSGVITRLGGLHAVLVERGSDLSSGQRQLLCLARAVLSKAKILCIDEATANIDHETDRLVQKTIRSVFKDSTVITIAHRLETILDSDRILVMDEGSMVEFDTPQLLLSNTNSLFYRLVHQQEWVQ